MTERKIIRKKISIEKKAILHYKFTSKMVVHFTPEKVVQFGWNNHITICYIFGYLPVSNQYLMSLKMVYVYPLIQQGSTSLKS